MGTEPGPPSATRPALPGPRARRGAAPGKSQGPAFSRALRPLSPPQKRPPPGSPRRAASTREHPGHTLFWFRRSLSTPALPVPARVKVSCAFPAAKSSSARGWKPKDTPDAPMLPASAPSVTHPFSPSLLTFLWARTVSYTLGLCRRSSDARTASPDLDVRPLAPVDCKFFSLL